MISRSAMAMLALFSGGNLAALAGFLLAVLGSPWWRPVFYAGCAGVFFSAVLGGIDELREWRAKRKRPRLCPACGAVMFKEGGTWYCPTWSSVKD